ncbi:MAG: nucleotide exchange factor GrpE [Clostridia bacterium]|nr:nucleotide exchange factor GrpE [Clostridia bacterium]
MSKDKKQHTANEPEREAEKPVEEAAETPAEETEQEAPAEETEQEAPAEETAKQPDALAELQKKLDEANDRLLRTAAEYDNFRRRSQKEKEAIYTDSKAEIIGKLLPVIDNFERAAAADADAENYKKGIEMTVKQLLDALTAMGVEAYGAAGDAFDPNIHNGVMHVDDETLGENVVTDVFIKGYKVGDKVIRHASVRVAN